MELSHVDKNGNITMVDVSAKPVIKRTALAEGRVFLSSETIDIIKKGFIKKGDPIACAKVAGILAAKKTGDLIPLCHPLPIDSVSVDVEFFDKGLIINSKAVTTAKTGIEMEVLTAVSVAALTIYDMCKAVDKKMVIGDISLIKKTKEVINENI